MTVRFHQDASRLGGPEAVVPADVHRPQPELRAPIVAVHVHVRRLARFVTVEVESVGTVSQDRRHRRPSRCDE